MEDIVANDDDQGGSSNLNSSMDSLWCDPVQIEGVRESVDGDRRKDRHSTSSDVTLEGVSNSESVSTLELCDSGEPDKQSPSSESNISRPDSLCLPRPLQQYERKRSKSDGQNQLASYINNSTNVITEWRSCRSASTTEEILGKKDPEFENIEETMLSKSMPHGTIVRKGEMIEFIAEDLQEKIRRSSPLTKTDSSGLSSRTSSLRSISSVNSMSSSSSAMATSSLMQQSPDDIPPIDASAILELEAHARRVADSVDLMMGNLRSNLHKMSAITVGCLDAYKTSVDVTCDSVDSSIKAMYALMAKCEELNNNMGPVYRLGDQIKEIKRLLDRFESQLTDNTS
ncbi:uncharacterized protein DDB_G0284127-like [Mizuhopecten yessoensis]|uniref:uncharacterized protein DDB_G0284127-like n=1 Tax=Mizuhopecten yessoensis TaxID=6573 RepID=UPI000B45933C|nr:uncharacterized protein DDB_G0284127-like [Mizuhopecten yessoensis]XP_021371045.1 uncharacterized protein DDB_G0284127-like [Mizuhopecten yessoensis]